MRRQGTCPLFSEFYIVLTFIAAGDPLTESNNFGSDAMTVSGDSEVDSSSTINQSLKEIVLLI